MATLDSNSGSSTSATLLARVRASGDTDAWQEFTRRYSRLIWWFGKDTGLSSSEAEDLVQEVLADFARQASALEYDPGRGRFRGLLRTIARRRAIDMLRRKQLPMDASVSLSRLESVEAAEQAWERLDTRSLVLRALEQVATEVEPVTYQAFQLHMLEGWSVKRVAEFLGISNESVYAAKSRLLARIRVSLAERADGGESP